MPSLLFFKSYNCHPPVYFKTVCIFRLTSSGILSSLQNSTCLQLTLAHRFFSLSIKSRTWWTYLNFPLLSPPMNGYRFQTPLQHFPCAKPYTTFCNRISFSSTFLINKVWYLQSEDIFLLILDTLTMSIIYLSGDAEPSNAKSILGTSASQFYKS